MKTPILLVVIAALFSLPAQAQDAARGARLFADTAGLTGKPVAACVACHADADTLREQIRNRGGKPDDAAVVARRLDAVIAGAQRGATNAKAQYRSVLTGRDLRDLAAYIARAKQAAAQPQLAGALPR